MKSAEKLFVGTLALSCAVSAGMAAWLVYRQHEDERAIQRFFDLQQRLAARATPIRAMSGPGETGYTCTGKNGFIYTAPTRSELGDVCSDRS